MNWLGPPLRKAEMQSLVDQSVFFHFSSATFKETFLQVEAVVPVHDNRKSRMAFPVAAESFDWSAKMNSAPQPLPRNAPTCEEVGSRPRMDLIPEPFNVCEVTSLIIVFALVVKNAQLSHANEPEDVVLMVQRRVIGVVVPTHAALVTVSTESVLNEALTAREALVASDASAGRVGRGAPSALLLAKYVA